jgi:hypothetical protein
MSEHILCYISTPHVCPVDNSSDALESLLMVLLLLLLHRYEPADHYQSCAATHQQACMENQTVQAQRCRQVGTETFAEGRQYTTGTCCSMRLM